MSLTLTGIDFGTYIHGTMNVPPWEFSVARQRVFGVAGEQTLYGQAHARNITIPYHLYGYSTHAALQLQIGSLSTEATTSGTLVVDLGGGDSYSFTNVSFEGFEPSEEPWKDGAGVNGWQVRGTLKFRQANA